MIRLWLALLVPTVPGLVVGGLGLLLTVLVSFLVPGARLPVTLVGIFASVVAGVVVGAWWWRQRPPVRRTDEAGLAVAPASQPELWAHITQWATYAGSRPPHEWHIVVEPTVEVVTFGGGIIRPRRALRIGLPVLSRLPLEEVGALVVHQLSLTGGRRHRGDALLVRLARSYDRTSQAGATVGRWRHTEARLFWRLATPRLAAAVLRADGDALRAFGSDAGRAVVSHHQLCRDWAAFRLHYADLGTTEQIRPRGLFQGFEQFVAAEERTGYFSAVAPAALLDPLWYPSMQQRAEVWAAADAADTPEGNVRRADALLHHGDALTELLELNAFPASHVPRDWATLVSDSAQRISLLNARELLALLGAETRAVTLESLLAELLSGRAGDLVEPLSGEAPRLWRETLAGLMVGDLVASLLVRDGRATFELNWGGPARLRDKRGVDLPVWELVGECASMPSATRRLRERLLVWGLDLDESLSPSGLT